MRGMILAAGFGTRFRPATFEIPKPLIPLCNRPLIAWPLDAMLAAGIREIVVNLHHLPDPLERYLADEYSGVCEFFFSREERILGTGGGIRRARRMLETGPMFVVANADTVQIPPFARLLEACRSRDAVAALLLRHPPEHDRFTTVWFDGGRVTGFGRGSGEPLMFAGAQAVSRRIFELLPEREVSGITEDVYIPLTRSGEGELAGVVDEGLWFDIGTPARYLEATREVLAAMRRGRVAIPGGSEIEGTSLAGEGAALEGACEETVAAAGARVAHSASVTASVLWEESEVGAGARIERSVIGRGVRIPPGSRIGNALICRRLPAVVYPEGTRVAGELVAVAVTRGEIVLEGLE